MLEMETRDGMRTLINIDLLELLSSQWYSPRKQAIK